VDVAMTFDAARGIGIRRRLRCMHAGAQGRQFIGMALFKYGVFSATRSPRFYLGFLLVAVLIGIPVIAYGIQRKFETGWDVGYVFFLANQYNYWGSLLVALGWVSAVMLIGGRLTMVHDGCRGKRPRFH